MRAKLWMRLMQPRDLAAVQEHCRRQNERDGTSYGVPEVFDAAGSLLPNTALALVTVDATGRVHAGHIFERTLEYMGFGGDARSIALSMSDAAAVFYALRAEGYRDLHIQVPKAHAAALEKALEQRMGMARDDERLAHFYRELAGGDA